MQVVLLDGISIKKEPKECNLYNNQAGKKNVISVQTKSGAVYLFHPPNEADVNEWQSTINDSAKENSTAAEYENGYFVINLVLSKLFVNPSDLSAPPPPSTTEQRKLTKTKAQNEKAVEKLPKHDTARKAITEEDNPDKDTVKKRLNNFFGGLKKMVVLVLIPRLLIQSVK